MITLALEFSGNMRSTAVISSDGNSAAKIMGEATDSGDRTLRPLTLIEKTLGIAGLKRGEVSAMAVGLGPGSYTGIRAAISIAQGWQLATGLKLQGVGSAEAIALQLQLKGIRDKVRIAIDAQRGEFYVTLLNICPAAIKVVEPIHLKSREQLDSLPGDEITLFGPGLSAKFPSAHDIDPSASAIGQLALTRNDFVPGELLEPIYLRATTFVKAPPPRFMP